VEDLWPICRTAERTTLLYLRTAVWLLYKSPINTVSRLGLTAKASSCDSRPDRIFFAPQCPDRPMGCSVRLILTRWNCEVDHSPVSSAVRKNTWINTSTSQPAFFAGCSVKNGKILTTCNSFRHLLPRWMTRTRRTYSVDPVVTVPHSCLLILWDPLIAYFIGEKINRRMELRRLLKRLLLQ
jgi:hypothetical protein